MSWLLAMTGRVTSTSCAGWPTPLSISRSLKTIPPGSRLPMATEATVCTWTTAPAPVSAATRACSSASADGFPPCTAAPCPSTNTTSAGVSSPLSWPLAVTASRSGSRESTTDRLPEVPRIQPKEANRADSAARTAPASSRSRALMSAVTWCS